MARRARSVGEALATCSANARPPAPGNAGGSATDCDWSLARHFHWRTINVHLSCEKSLAIWPVWELRESYSKVGAYVLLRLWVVDKQRKTFTVVLTVEATSSRMSGSTKNDRVRNIHTQYEKSVLSKKNSYSVWKKCTLYEIFGQSRKFLKACIFTTNSPILMPLYTIVERK
jgi:hypothetical protein